MLAGLAIACGDEPTTPAPISPGASVTEAAAAGSWSTRAAYPLDVFDATSVALTVGGRNTMYVIGGYPVCCGPGRISDAVRAYDVAGNTWKTRARYPVRVQSTNGAVELNGRIYVSGGFTRRWDEAQQVWRLSTLNRLYVYNPATDTWSRKRDMPVTTANGVSVV